MIEFELQNAKEVQAALDKIWKATPKEAGRALYEEAQIERTESMNRTPVLTGALKGSHRVEGPDFSADAIICKITVGGPAIKYAWPVHENLDAFHRVGQAKFLESTLMQSKPYMAKRVANRIDLNRTF